MKDNDLLEHCSSLPRVDDDISSPNYIGFGSPPPLLKMSSVEFDDIIWKTLVRVTLVIAI